MPARASKPGPTSKAEGKIDTGSWRVTILDLPKGRTRTRAMGFAGADVLGSAEAGRVAARQCLWVGGRPELVDEPKGFDPWAACAGQLVGRVVVKGKDRATLVERRDGSRTLVDLHPAGYATSVAHGCAGGRQVGYGQRAGQKQMSPLERALLWSGSAQGVVELRGPDPELQTRALAAADDGVQVGEYGRNWGCHAAMWRGSSESMAQLHPEPPRGYPPDSQVSSARGAGDGQQVGVLAWKKTQLAEPVSRAALWTGSAASFVDLTPRDLKHAAAEACAAGFQVGWATRIDLNKGLRATLWRGSAEDHVDLHELLPPPWNRSSAADIQVAGSTLRVVGTVALLEEERGYDVVRLQRVALWEATLR
jgi:hypothetical protein